MVSYRLSVRFLDNPLLVLWRHLVPLLFDRLHKCKLSGRFESEIDTISGETFSRTMSNRPAAFGMEGRFRNSGYRALADGGLV